MEHRPFLCCLPRCTNALSVYLNRCLNRPELKLAKLGLDQNSNIWAVLEDLWILSINALLLWKIIIKVRFNIWSTNSNSLLHWPSRGDIFLWRCAVETAVETLLKQSHWFLWFRFHRLAPAWEFRMLFLFEKILVATTQESLNIATYNFP